MWMVVAAWWGAFVVALSVLGICEATRDLFRRHGLWFERIGETVLSPVTAIRNRLLTRRLEHLESMRHTLPVSADEPLETDNLALLPDSDSCGVRSS